MARPPHGSRGPAPLPPVAPLPDPPPDPPTVVCTGIDGRGEGVAELETTRGPIRVAVPDLLPGERAEVALTWRDRRAPRGRARVLTLLERHPERVVAPCPHHPANGGKCAGCPLQTLSPAGQARVKRDDLVERLGLPVEELVQGASLGYRWSAKRVVAGRPGAMVLGSRVPHSDRIADMSACRVDHPAIVAAAHELVEAANRLGIAPYRPATPERAASGDLRYVWFKTDGDRVLVTLITGGETSRAPELAPALHRAHSVAWSVQRGSGNTIRGSQAEVLRGPGTLAFTLSDMELRAGPLGFLQPNPPVAAQAHRDLTSGPPAPDALAFDLYAGSGVTTHLLRRRFGEVRACEAHPESAADLGVAPSTVEDFLRDQLDRGGARPHLVVANPPRGGMGDAVCAGLRRLGAPELRIMSCRPDTLARDLAALSAPASPGEVAYVLVAARAYDTLPHTTHLEVVVWLAPRGSIVIEDA